MDQGRLSSYRESTLPRSLQRQNSNAGGQESNQKKRSEVGAIQRERDELRDSVTTQVTQRIHSHNNNAVAFLQETSPKSVSSLGPMP